MSVIGHARSTNRAKTRWEIKYRINRKVHYETIDARSEREALAEIAKRVVAGVALTGSTKLTFADYLPTWLAGLDVKPLTRRSYESVVRVYLKPAFGDVRVRELTPSGIKAAFVKWHREGSARSSLRQVKIVLQSCLRSAVDDEIISHSPMDRLRARKGQKNPLPIGMPPKAEPVSADKIAELLAEESPYHILIVLMVAAGLRRGETLALRWRNVDFERARIKIEEQRIPLKGGAQFAEPKAASSVRTITLPAQAIEQLKAPRKAVAETMLGYGKRLSPETTVACSTLGAPLNPDAFTSWAHRRGIKLHNLRHAHLSALANSGIPIAAVSKRAGHSTIATTLATYVHAEDADDEAAAAVAGGLMHG